MADDYIDGYVDPKQNDYLDFAYEAMNPEPPQPRVGIPMILRSGWDSVWGYVPLLGIPRAIGDVVAYIDNTLDLSDRISDVPQFDGDDPWESPAMMYGRKVDAANLLRDIRDQVRAQAASQAIATGVAAFVVATIMYA